MKVKHFKLLILISAILFTGCKTRQDIFHLLNQELMNANTNTSQIPTDTFNIEEYNKNKNRFGVYKHQIDDIKISQGFDKDDNSYWMFVEKGDNPYYSNMYEYYLSGIIKRKSKIYVKNSSFIETGIWEYYDEQGRLIKTEDMDKKEKLNYKKALDLVNAHFHYFANDINLNDQGSRWFIHCVSGKNKDQGAFIDKKTGKVTKIDKIETIM